MPGMTDKPFSEYAERNGAPILSVLQNEFANCSKVLEIGSGTGQHAVRFARALPYLQWQSSDRDENLGGINAWVKDSGLANLLPANTAHIMSIEAVQKMFALVGKGLSVGGVFCLYGPFRQEGQFNTPSNAAFHQTLRSRNPEMGIRHLESLDDYARDHDMVRVKVYAMPANNHIAVWHKVAV